MAGDYFNERPMSQPQDPNQRRRPQPGGAIEFGNYPDAFGQHGAPFAGAVQVARPGSDRSMWVDQMHLNEDGTFRNGLGFDDFDPQTLAFRQAEMDRESAQRRADARMAEIALANRAPVMAGGPINLDPAAGAWPDPTRPPNPSPEEMERQGLAMLNSRGTRDAEFPYSDADGNVINAPRIGEAGVIPPPRIGEAGVPPWANQQATPRIGEAGVPDDATIQSYNRAALVRAINGQAPEVGMTRPNEEGETFPVVGHVTRMDGVNVPMVRIDNQVRVYNPATGEYEDVTGPEWAAFLAGGAMPGR